jgi:uncharacterized protein YbjT (DUF2867 family)
LTSELILVTGATGYIASRLIPRLLASGYRVRAMARDPQKLSARKWARDVELIPGDVTRAETLPAAVQDIHTAYYLIHNMSSGHGYTEIEIEAAQNFASAAEAAGVQHIIYLGGLADPEGDIAPHMRSRIETGEVLRRGKIPVTEFRAGVIIGPGSISFEMIRFMTEQFPVLPGPGWLKNKSQPIAIQNILDYLIAALENKNGRGKIFEIGGPDIKVYSDLMQAYARQRKLRRLLFTIPGIPVWLMAFFVDRLSPIPYPIAYALIGGLQSDSMVRDNEAQKIFSSVKLIGFDDALETSLAQLHPDQLEPIWKDGAPRITIIRHEGFFIDHRSILADHFPKERILKSIEKYFSTYAVEDSSPDRILLRSETFGTRWIEWRLERNSKRPAISQTFFYAPRGLPGFLHWHLNPFRQFLLRSIFRKITG